MKKELSSALLIVATILCSIVSRSCANTQTPPSGGPKDTLPPVLMAINPAFNTTGFPTVGGKIEMEFDEYTVIKDMNGVYVSPVMKKKPTLKVRNKDIILTFNDTLKENTTYTVDFGNALADNNEGNIFPRMVFTFSTGNEIDSMYFTGRIVDCEKLLPVKNALVAIYTSDSDSACFNEDPVSATKTDDWGFFAIRNVKPLEYRVIAFTDKDGDSRYTIGADQVAFYDGRFSPTKVVNDDVYELKGFDMKDTAACEQRITELELRMFQEYSSRQYISEKGRINKKAGYIKFAAKDAEVSSFKILGVADSNLVVQFSPRKDSMCFWINTKSILPDSLMATVGYMRTDSLGKLSPTTETIVVAMTKEQISESRKAETREREKADTVFTLNREFDPATVEQLGIRYRYEVPLISKEFDSLIFTQTNPKNLVDTIGFKIVPDTSDVLTFTIIADTVYQAGFKYEFTIPENALTDIYGRKNKEEKVSFSLPNDDKLSTITLNLSNVTTRYIIELVNKDKTRTIRKYTISQDTSLFFPYVKADVYALRITEDRNGNGIFDSGDLLNGIQPEVVRIFKLEDGSELFQIPEQTDVTQDIIL